MKHSVLVLFLMLCWTAACGKVGDPRPPSIRVPARIANLTASQNEYNVTLSWTNPSKYVDGSNATDLQNVRIFRNGTKIGNDVDITGAGKQQTFALNEKDVVGTMAVYTIEVWTRRGKSAESNRVSLDIVDVPGAVLITKSVMDQGRIRLEWQPPTQRASLADVYFVHRDDGGLPLMPIPDTHFDDMTVEAGKTYRYTVTAAHGTSTPVSGPPSTVVEVTAKDRTPPAAPKGLQTPVISGTGAILTWDMNTETDRAGYLVYRSDSPDPSTFTSLDNEAIHTISSVRDENYRPGTYYAVRAVDESGNKSDLSSPVRAP